MYDSPQPGAVPAGGGGVSGGTLHLYSHLMREGVPVANTAHYETGGVSGGPRYETQLYSHLMREGVGDASARYETVQRAGLEDHPQTGTGDGE